jgi:hypothetical protein
MSVTTAGAAEASRLDMGRVISMTLRVMAARAPDIILIGLPFVFLPNLLVELLPQDLSVFRLAAGLPGLVFLGGVSLIAFRELAGGARIGAGEAIAAGARRFGSLWGAAIITNIGAGLGLLLLIVPGLVVGACLGLASSAVMVEDQSATGAIDRAWRLTQGSRWRMTALLLAALAAILLLLLLSVIVGIVLGLALGPDLGVKVGRIVWAPFATIFILAVTTVGSTSAYVALREAQQGPLNVAEVFA